MQATQRQLSTSLHLLPFDLERPVIFRSALTNSTYDTQRIPSPSAPTLHHTPPQVFQSAKRSINLLESPSLQSDPAGSVAFVVDTTRLFDLSSVQHLLLCCFIKGTCEQCFLNFSRCVHMDAGSGGLGGRVGGSRE